MNGLKLILWLLFVIGSAYVSYDFALRSIEIPFTGQSLAIMLMAAFLKPKESLMVILIYLLIGGLGFPVFADGTNGWDKFLSGSGGFLYGFIFVTFYISTRFSKEALNGYQIFAVLLIASMIMFAFGVSHLSFKYGLDKALENGFTPFVIPALLKVFIATGIIYAVKAANI